MRVAIGFKRVESTGGAEASNFTARGTIEAR